MTTLPILKTRRLILRPLSLDDAGPIADLCGRDFDVARWLTSATWPYEDGAAEAFVRALLGTDPLAGEAVFAVTLGGVFIGVMAVQAPGDLDEQPECPTIGYWFGRAFQGHGYAIEAANAVLDWAFAAFGASAIAARVFEDNSRSRNLLRRAGFRPAGTCERYSKALDRKVANIIVRLERAEFEGRGKAA